MTQGACTVYIIALTAVIVLMMFIHTNTIAKRDAYIFFLETREVMPTEKACNKMIFDEMESREGFILSTQLPVRKP
jgi:hypothetical protein